jgi:protein SCO1/2
MQKKLKIILIAVWTVAGLAVGGVAAGVWLYRATQHSPSIQLNGTDPDAHLLDALFDAPSFTLIDQDGKPFDSSALKGKVWVADFVFTTCTSLCPMMTQQMHDFQQKTAGSPTGSTVQMVSFSVDPEHDTPAALKDYAQTNKADLSRWHFLTGDKETLWKISNAMKLAVGPGDDHQVMHSSHFLLVDAGGHVRGIYDYNTPGNLEKLAADAQTLLKSK